MEQFITTFGLLGLIFLFVLTLLVAILYFLLPFAVFGIKPMLTQLIRLQKKQNQLLRYQISLMENDEEDDEDEDIDKNDPIDNAELKR